MELEQLEQQLNIHQELEQLELEQRLNIHQELEQRERELRSILQWVDERQLLRVEERVRVQDLSILPEREQERLGHN